MLDDAVIAENTQSSKPQPPPQPTQPQPQRRASDVERRKSVEVERRKPSDVVMERRKSNQDVCRINNTGGVGAVVAAGNEDAIPSEPLTRKTSRSISESIVNAKGLGRAGTMEATIITNAWTNTDRRSGIIK